MVWVKFLFVDGGLGYCLDLMFVLGLDFREFWLMFIELMIFLKLRRMFLGWRSIKFKVTFILVVFY